MKERMYATEFLFSGLFYGFLFTIAFLLGYSLGNLLFKEEIILITIKMLVLFPSLFCLFGLLLDLIRSFKKKMVKRK